MASCITSQWKAYAPQAKLTVEIQSQTETQAVLKYTLQYIASSAAQTNNTARAYTIKVGSSTITGTYDIDNKKGTYTVKTGTVTIDKTKAAQNIAFSISFTMNLTWTGVYKGTVSASGSITVSAKTSYTIAYNANGGSGVPSSQTKWHGETLTLSNSKPSRTGYSFVGWHYDEAQADSGTYYYQAGGSCGKNENLTLYAVWKANTYTVTYNANGGSLGNVSATQTKTYGVTLKLDPDSPTRTNYNFLGWAKSASSTVVDYKAGANYTPNQAITLYAVWELAYVPPRITNVKIERCVEVTLEDGTVDYEYSDTGTLARVSLDYACDKNITEIEIIVYRDDTQEEVFIHSYDFSDGDTEGTFTVVCTHDPNIGEGVFNPERTYTVEINVMDDMYGSDEATGLSTAFATLNGMNLPIDVLIDDETGPKGVSFGKPAELEDKADFNYEILPRKGFRNVLLQANTDLNDVMSPNTYYGENTSTYNYGNCPITNGTFTLTVAAGGDNGQRVQTLVSVRKTDFVVWKRFYYTNEWGDWYQEYSAAGILLAHPNYYMNADQVVNLSQKISTLPHGIVLVFSLYDAENKEAMNQEFYSHFIHKYLITNHSGKGHNINLCGMFGNAVKYLYIHDEQIVGHEKNNQDLTIGGISYTNNRFVLRYVIGV